jgi:hypothetical protein
MKRTFGVLPKPDNLIRYRQKMSVNYGISEPGSSFRPSLVVRHEQVAAEVDMHSEVLPVMGQRLDLVFHRVG